MPRPRKDPRQTRKRWDALYVTEQERASIAAAAHGQNCSPGQYLIGLHHGRRPARPASEARALTALARAETALLQLAHKADGWEAGADICAALISLERVFERAALSFVQVEGAEP